MGLPRNAPKTSALLTAAIRKLKNIRGSTSREITNYIASECDSPVKNIKRQMKLALRRGLSAGVLHRSKNGYYTCATLDDRHAPTDRTKSSCGRRRSRCGKRRSRRRGRGGKKRCGKRGGHRRRRGMKSGRRGGCRKSRSRRGCRRKRKCGGRHREDGIELDELADRGSARKQRPKRTRDVPKSKNTSKTSSQMRISSASSADTQRSGDDTASATLSASGKESLTDQSDISGASDQTGGETKP